MRLCRSLDYNYVVQTCVPTKQVYSRFKNLPKYMQRIVCKEHFLWKARHTLEGSSTFKKCSKQFRSKCIKFLRNIEQKIVSAPRPGVFFSYVNRRLKSKLNVGCLHDSDGNVLTIVSSKCEKFVQYFKSAFIVDDGQLPEFPVICGKFLDNVNTHCVLIKNPVLSLNDKLSITPEIIRSYFLKRVVDTVVYTLSLTFKNSFVMGSLPFHWKTAVVSLFLKRNRLF